MRSMQLGGFAVTSPLLAVEADRRLAAALAGGIAALALLGCADVGAGLQACARPATEAPRAYTGGTVEDGVYMTSPWHGELLSFTGGAWYEIHHELGEVPQWFQFYLSFERDGLGSGSVAHAAGNQVEVKAIDDQTLTVLNGTCVDYWLLGVVGTGGQSPPP